jgi:hypothetical protein
MLEPELMKAFQINLSLLSVPELSTPVDALHAYVIRFFQTQGSFFASLSLKLPKS